MSWDDARLFLALCRSKTVGDAGRLLGVDASTVSRRLAVLEEALGATLFERSRTGIAPTEAAHELIPVAEQIEDAMGRFVGAAEAFEREVAGLVRITCPPDAAEVLLEIGSALRKGASTWPEDELFMVTHRALRDVPRVRAVWDFLLEHAAERRGRTSRAVQRSDLTAGPRERLPWRRAGMQRCDDRLPVYASAPRTDPARSWTNRPWRGA